LITKLSPGRGTPLGFQLSGLPALLLWSWLPTHILFVIGFHFSILAAFLGSGHVEHRQPHKLIHGRSPSPSPLVKARRSRNDDTDVASRREDHAEVAKSVPASSAGCDGRASELRSEGPTSGNRWSRYAGTTDIVSPIQSGRQVARRVLRGVRLLGK
jgi:hypothetical protein